jgi:hypothetical protein
VQQDIDLLIVDLHDLPIDAYNIARWIDFRPLFADGRAVHLDASSRYQAFGMSARGHTCVGQEARESLAWAFYRVF